MDPLALLILLVSGFLLTGLAVVSAVAWFWRRRETHEPHGRAHEQMKARALELAKHWRDN